MIIILSVFYINLVCIPYCCDKLDFGESTQRLFFLLCYKYYTLLILKICLRLNENVILKMRRTKKNWRTHFFYTFVLSVFSCIKVILHWISYFFCVFTSILIRQIANAKMNFSSQNVLSFFLTNSNTCFDFQDSVFAYILYRVPMTSSAT